MPLAGILLQALSANPRETMFAIFYRVLTAVTLSSVVIHATDYWIATNGVNTNPGTRDLPFLTIAKAVSIARPGDVINVNPGTYDEKVTPWSHGLTFRGFGYPIVRGFDCTDMNNWTITGFHVYHPSTAYLSDGVYLNRCTNYAIIDNYFDSLNVIHGGVSSGVAKGQVNYASYGLVRSNVFFRIGLANGSTVPMPNICIGGTNNLIEYNDVSQGDDFTRIFGRFNIVRNNYFHDAEPLLYSNAPHIDGMQTFDAVDMYPNFQFNLMECNLVVSNSTKDGHIFILQNPFPKDTFYISDFTFRRNVAVHTGDGIGIVDDAPNVRTYNNTYVGVREEFGQYDFCIEASTNYNGTGTIVPTNFVAINNIFHSACNSFGTIFADQISAAAPMFSVIANNLSFRSGSTIRGSLGGDLFVDPGISDTVLTPSSTFPGIGKSRAQTVTTGSGSNSNIIPVKDAGFFCSGWGIRDVDGDSVIIGSNPAVTITSIDYTNNTLTVSQNISWSSGASVFLEGTQDIGAYNFISTGYGYDIQITSPSTGTAVSASTTVTAAVTNPSAVRFVKFYVDGLEVGGARPAASVSFPITINQTNFATVVQARAYPKFADKKLAAVATIRLNDSSLLPPAKLAVSQP